MAFNKSQVQFLIQNEILEGLTWEFPSRGLLTGAIVQEKVDQFTHRIPFRPISSAGLQVPSITNSSQDLFLDSESPTLTLLEADLDVGSQTYDMEAIAATLQIPSSALGTDTDGMLQQFIVAFGRIMKRFLSLGLVYGGYTGTSTTPVAGPWLYYWDDPNSFAGWDQGNSFDGLQQMCGTPGVSPGSWNDGYSLLLSSSLTLGALDNFLRLFKGSNNGHIDYLVMNWEVREAYLALWRTAGQLPEYMMDPMTGKRCLAHDGIPILINDYIMTYDENASETYLASDANPENVTGTATDRQSSIYAVVLGEENQGLFGIYPESFGASPIKIERATSSQSEDTILFRGMIEAGLVTKTHSSIGRLGGIVL